MYEYQQWRNVTGNFQILWEDLLVKLAKSHITGLCNNPSPGPEHVPLISVSNNRKHKRSNAEKHAEQG